MNDHYAPNTAINEYQARLAAQAVADKAATQHTPGDMVAVYDLKERVPNWNMLLNMGAGKGGLGIYTTEDLFIAYSLINRREIDGDWYKPGDYHFSIKEQSDRLEAELESRNHL